MVCFVKDYICYSDRMNICNIKIFIFEYVWGVGEGISWIMGNCYELIIIDL